MSTNQKNFSNSTFRHFPQRVEEHVSRIVGGGGYERSAELEIDFSMVYSGGAVGGAGDAPAAVGWLAGEL